MADNLDLPDEQLTFTDKEIFTRIWLSPRVIFKYIHDHKFDKYVTPLLILAGISRAFDRASMKDIGDNLSLWPLLAACIILGGLFGWITFYLYAALIHWTGKWLEGKGDTPSLLRMMAFALIPSVVALIFLVPQIGIYGIEMFKSDGDITSAGLIPNILVYSSLFLEFVFSIWTIVLCVIGISEVQQLSIGKSILNALLPILVIIVPVFIIVLILY
jgi:hypothetical protein